MYVDGVSVTEEPQAELERRYRRLLRWYPRAYRAAVGAELVTTLLDAAGPDRRRPSRREVVDLARGGLRQRFRLPVGVGVRVTAVAAALALGAMGAALGTRAAWLTSSGLPADARARQIIGTVMGVPYEHDLNRSTGPFDSLRPEKQGSPAYVGNARSANHPGATAEQVAGRLAAAGWSVRPASGGRELSASRDGLVVHVQLTHGPGAAPADETFFSVTIVQDEPGPLPAALAAGWLAGAVGGWLLVAATAYRVRRHGPVVRVFAGLLTAGALTAILLPTLVACTMMLGFAAPDRFPVAPWTGYTLWPLDRMTLLAAVATVGVVTLSVVPPQWQAAAPAADPGPRPAG